MKVVIAGGTGSLGRRLADDLSGRGSDVVILTRSRRDDISHRQIEWDGRNVAQWESELQDAVLMNLAGASIGDRPRETSSF